MAVRLRALRDDEFDSYVEHTKVWFTRQLVADGVGPDQASALADEQTASMLPDRLESPGQFVFAIEDEDTGERVGDAWLARRESPLLGALAFVASIEIAKPFRRRGFARQAMLFLEDEARSRGLDRITLNVYGDNDAARALYLSLGHAERAITMGKEL